MDTNVCDGYEELGIRETACTSKQIVVIGPGGENYCTKHRNMAGTIVREKINGEWITY